MAAILKERGIAIDTVTLLKKGSIRNAARNIQTGETIVMKNIDLSKVCYTSLGWKKLIFG